MLSLKVCLLRPPAGGSGQVFIFPLNYDTFNLLKPQGGLKLKGIIKVKPISPKLC